MDKKDKVHFNIPRMIERCVQAEVAIKFDGFSSRGSRLPGTVVITASWVEGPDSMPVEIDVASHNIGLACMEMSSILECRGVLPKVQL